MKRAIIFFFIFTATVAISMVLIPENSNFTKADTSIFLATDSTNDYTQEYEIIDSVYRTNTTVRFHKENRIMITNSLPNHATGTFPNAGNPNRIRPQNKRYVFPLEPKMSGEVKPARVPGVALNGVKFEPGTAERFICESGEVYQLEAFQDLMDLGLDSNNAHVQPTGEYHYHGIPTEFINTLSSNQDLVLVGFAMDGFPMYYSKSGKYQPSYQLSEESRTGEACDLHNPHNHLSKDLDQTNADGTFVSDWEFIEGSGDLDECNGITLNGKYIYLVTKEYPYVSRCLKGEFKEVNPPHPPGIQHPAGPPPGGIPHGHPHGHGHH